MESTHWATASDLPPELVDEILTYIANDTTDLRTCSLFTPTWTQSSRAYLFRAVDIHPIKVVSKEEGAGTIFDTEASLARVQTLHDALVRCPYIGGLVQHLSFSLDSASCAPDTPLAPLLADVFRRLHAVQSLTLEDIIWDGLAADVRDALTSVLVLPSLSFLSLSRLTFPTFVDLALLVGRLGPGPKQLAVGDIVYHAAVNEAVREQFESLNARPVADRPTLAALTETSPAMRGAEFGALANWLASGYGCVEARKVERISASWSSLSMFLPLVHASRLALRELQLCALVDLSLSPSGNPPIALADLPALEVLVLVNNQVDTYDAAPWLAAFLDSRAGPTALVRIGMRLVPPRRWHLDPEDHAPLSMYDYAPWTEVDRVLSEGAADFPALKELNFELANPMGMDVVRGVKMDAGMLHSAMAKMREKGILRVYGSGVKR